MARECLTFVGRATLIHQLADSATKCGLTCSHPRSEHSLVDVFEAPVSGEDVKAELSQIKVCIQRAGASIEKFIEFVISLLNETDAHDGEYRLARSAPFHRPCLDELGGFPSSPSGQMRASA